VIASLLTIGLGLTLLVTQSAIATLVPVHDVTPNVVLPIVVYMGVASEVQLVRGALASFVLGYLLDAFCGSSMGLHTFVMVAAFFASRGAGLRLFPQAAVLQVLAMFVAAAGSDATVYALRGIFEQPVLPGLGEDLKATVKATAASALATAVLSPVIVAMARRIEATRHRREERAVIGKAHL
jgi:rod shape-determining protein MreD